jgi:fucose permease
MIGAVRATGTWRWGLAALLVFYVPMVGVMAATRASWGRPMPKSAQSGRGLRSKQPVARTLALFGMSTGIEAAGGQWAFSILVARGIADGAAAGFAAAYWGGLTAGRLAGAVAGERLGRRVTLAGSLVLLGIGHTILWLDPLGLGAWGLPIAGAGTALVFPTLVLVTESVHGDASDFVMGWGFAAAAGGAATLPWLAGIIGSRTDLDVIPLVILAAIGVFAMVLTPLLRREPSQPVVLHSPDD